MKPRERTDVEFKSTLSGSQTAMTIDPAAMSHIMSLLSDLYKYPVLAVIREYSTNAWDAHIEEGVDLPIEITLPTAMTPTFKVQDFGVGLSSWEIENIYAQYGKSTKRESDDFNGMLGLGCKSAFAYTSQFTVTSIKDGIGCRVNISKDGDAAGVVNVVDTFETDDHSGTTVTILTKKGDEYEFKRWADHLFSYWKQGTVLVNGSEPQRFAGEKVNDQFYIIKGYHNYVVMGNVPYSVPTEEIDHGLQYGSSLVAFTPIGSVDIPPNRETLKNTPYTQETLKALSEDFKDIILDKAQEDVDEAPNRRQAISRRRKWVNKVAAIKLDSLTYKGDDIPELLELPEVSVFAPAYNTHKLTEHTRSKQFDMEMVADSICFSGYDRAKFTPASRKKLDMWIDDHEFESWSGFLLTEDPVVSDWMDASRQFNWEDVVSIKLPRNARTKSGTRVGAYEGLIGGRRDVDILAEEIDDTKPLFYLEGSMYDLYKYQNVFDLEYGESGYTIIALSTRRLAKFKRIFPSAVSCRSVWNKLRNEAIASIPDGAKRTLAYRDTLGKFLKIKNFYYLDDPELVHAIELANSNIDDVQDLINMYNIDNNSIALPDVLNFNRRYTMFSFFIRNIFHDEWDKYEMEIIEYINAIYHSTIKDD